MLDSDKPNPVESSGEEAKFILDGHRPLEKQESIPAVGVANRSEKDGYLVGFLGHYSQEKLRSRLQSCEIGALSTQNVTGAPCSKPCTPYGTVRCPRRVADEHIQSTSEGS